MLISRLAHKTLTIALKALLIASLPHCPLAEWFADQATDVFVSLHGSGEANALFMKRYSSIKVQLRPKEFGTRNRYFSNGCVGVGVDVGVGAGQEQKLFKWFVTFVHIKHLGLGSGCSGPE